MRTLTIGIILLLSLTSTSGQTNYQKDFQYYWQTIRDHFAYFNKQHTDWDKVRMLYQPIADTIKTKAGFIQLLETINNELYNGHVFLNMNTNSSNRTIPTGTDLKVSWINNRFVITEIREGFNADLCGLKTRMEVIKYNNIPIMQAITKFLPRSVPRIDNRMYEYSANMLLAGTHDTKREITTRVNEKEQTYYPDIIPNKTEASNGPLLEAKIISKNIAYIKINNSLGNPDLVNLFDKALDSMMTTAGLILDLRETPSGGNTTVARAMMGRFIDKDLPYQKHLYTDEERESGIKRTTLELVSPRQKIYKKPLIILVGYWTGSMGEGIAIGFDGMKRGKIAGTRMAGLLGEIYTFETPEAKIPFSIPFAQLQHINGQPREDFIPTVLVTDQKQTMKIATNLLTGKNKKDR